MSEISNKKILNAKATSYNDINFKSKLEVACYKKLAASGLAFAYEPDTIVIWEGNKITNTVGYFPDKNKMLVPKTNIPSNQTSSTFVSFSKSASPVPLYTKSLFFAITFNPPLEFFFFFQTFSLDVL